MQYQQSFLFSWCVTIMLAVSANSYGAQPQNAIANALYAEVHGLPTEQCIRVYKGCIDSEVVHGKVKSIVCRRVMPRIDFFDALGVWIRTEPLAPHEMANEAGLIKAVQERLTVLPLAQHADVFAIKAPGNQWIDLYSPQGHRIATVGRFDVQWPSILQEGDLLPPAAIVFFAPYVRNPEALKNVRIRSSHYDIKLK
jgi:hypothetical protein